MRYSLASGNTLIVRGPASLQLLDGKATVLGSPLDKSRKLIVPYERQLPIEAASEVDLEIALSEKGSIFELDGSTIPNSWKSAVHVLREMEQGKVMIIGATDVGKSTLTAFLTNSLMATGLKPLVVDADIGQADIGPPTTIGRAAPSGYLSSLVDLSPESLLFIGHTSPSQVEGKLIDGIRRLTSNMQQSLIIIDTDGWVMDPEAVLYKVRMVKTIEPNLVLGIAAGTELEPILSGAGVESFKVESPETVLERSRTDRRQLRRAGYRRFLDGGSIRSFPRSNFTLKLPRGLTSVQGPPDHELGNLIVGLLDSAGFLLQIGVLLSFEGNSLRVYSRPAEGLNEIQVGYVKLSTDGTELGYLQL